MNRLKNFIIISFTALTMLLSPTNTARPEDRCPAKGDGNLSLYSYPLDEYLEATYKMKGSYEQGVLKKIYRALRSPDGETYPIDIQLIEIIDNIQDHFGARTVEIISGFRSEAYNKKLKEEGRNVARESLHMKGQALDIHIDEITEQALRDYAAGLKCGGVGFYPDNDFVHVDTGRVHYWGKKGGPRKLVGMNNNPSPHSLIADKNDYFKNDTIRLILTNGSEGPIEIPTCAKIEMFDKGRWKPVGRIDLWTPTKILGVAETLKIKIDTQPKICNSPKRLKLDYGRFRLRTNLKSAAGKATPMLSNEFYLKKY